MCDPIQIEGITPDDFSEIVEKAASQGLVLTGTSGTAELQGCTFSWFYDESVEILTITCTHKPFYVGCDTVNDKIRELVTA